MSNVIQIPKMEAIKPEITMAPLVDIVFLLLIFFMVTTVFPDKGLLIDKPSAETSDQLDSNNITITLHQDGRIYFKNELLTVDDVRRILKVKIAVQPDIQVIIQVDKRTVTEKLITLMDAAKSAGAKRLGIATDEPDRR